MNVLSYDSYELIKYLNDKGYINQRIISDDLNLSLGKVNRLLNDLNKLDFLNKHNYLTDKARQLIECNRPKRAIILAAGNGLRMIPINHDVSKALLNVKGEILIERIIKQLLEIGIKEIYIVIGFMKEEFEYLIDKYNVKLIVNSEYFSKNNLHSLFLARNYISNSYIIPCDLYFQDNPFSINELQSWYMVSNSISKHSNITLNKKNELCKINSYGLKMIGLSYINQDNADAIKLRLEEYHKKEKYESSFWEEILFKDYKMIIFGRVFDKNKIFEINTYEDLRNIDSESTSLDNSSIKLIADIFNTKPIMVKNISYLKKGMTNKSFLFEYSNDKYIMRIPGEGTDQLIDRSAEYSVYQTIKGYNLSDEIIYMNPNNGYKISRFIKNTRTCDINEIEDLKLCMSFLKKFHKLDLTVAHYFDIYEKIDFYESLRGNKSLYKDYADTKENVLSLRKIVENFPRNMTLTHIDAVPDNFLIFQEKNKQKIKLIDWEYAAMQDPHIDIAMFCIYSLYNKEQIDQLIDIYFEDYCDIKIRIKIYCYISICGLLWSNWCEYKYSLGVEFGEYSLAQYRYAKDYYRIAMAELQRLEKI